MGTEGRPIVPIAEELDRARRTSGRFWLLQLLHIPDSRELVAGWSELPRGGRWIMIALAMGLIMAVPLVGVAVALLR